MTAIIKFNNVQISFPLFKTESLSIRKFFLERKRNLPHIIKAINNLNLEINPGERVGVYGHNGAGKTTLLRTITGAYPVTSGSYNATGSIGSLIDLSLGLDYDASGLVNIKLKLGLLGKGLRNDHDLIKKIIEFSELGNFIDYPVKTYSSGMLMRLLFSIVTHVHFDILVLDEWLSVGDESFSLKANEKLKNIIEKSSILVIASQNMDLLKNICNRIIVLDHGNIISDKTINV